MSKTTTNETKKEFKMKDVFTMWLYTSKNNKGMYLSGRDVTGQKLVGFFNGKKNNPKEPDVRIYACTEDGISKEEYISLWCNVSKNGKKFLSGKMGGTRVVGFISSRAEADGTIPYFTVYFSEADEVKKAQEEVKQAEEEKQVKMPL